MPRNCFVHSCFYVLCLAFTFLDDVLQPTVPPQNQRTTSASQQSGKILANDLDSSLANLVGSKCEAFKFKLSHLLLFCSPRLKILRYFLFLFPPQILALEELHPKSKFTYVLLILSHDYLVVSVIYQRQHGKSLDSRRLSGTKHSTETVSSWSLMITWSTLTFEVIHLVLQLLYFKYLFESP